MSTQIFALHQAQIHLEDISRTSSPDARLTDMSTIHGPDSHADRIATMQQIAVSRRRGLSGFNGLSCGNEEFFYDLNESVVMS